MERAPAKLVRWVIVDVALAAESATGDFAQTEADFGLRRRGEDRIACCKPKAGPGPPSAMGGADAADTFRCARR